MLLDSYLAPVPSRGISSNPGHLTTWGASLQLFCSKPRTRVNKPLPVYTEVALFDDYKEKLSNHFIVRYDKDKISVALSLNDKRKRKCSLVSQRDKARRMINSAQ